MQTLSPTLISIILALSVAHTDLVAQEPVFEVEGAVKIGGVNSSHHPGTIRYQNSAFEGWNGNTWIPLSKFRFAGTVTDIDGNEYKTIQICDQLWMAENLRTTRYNDGDLIQISVGGNITNPGAIGTMYYPDDDPSNALDYGSFYDFYCVETEKLCPVGWHVPNDVEWQRLLDNNEGLGMAGYRLKESGLAHWQSENIACNDSGFTARGTGIFDSVDFGLFHMAAYFWSTTVTDGHQSRWFLNNQSTYFSVNKVSDTPDYGMSIRCIKD
jgi:uncharacterized protein (TIGR02145 family)